MHLHVLQTYPPKFSAFNIIMSMIFLPNLAGSAPDSWKEPDEARKNRELRESQSDPRPIGEKLSCSSLVLGTPGSDDEQFRSTCLTSTHFKQFIDPADAER